MIKIIEPILERDFEAAHKLVEENLYKHDLAVEDLKQASSGELLIAKDGDKVIGLLNMRRPGKIFKELEDKYFHLKELKPFKSETGYIALVTVDKKYQGQGIGKLLVERAIEIQKEWDVSAIIVHASKSSPGNGSEKLFANFGFVPVHLHKQAWHDYSVEKGPEGFWCNFCGNPCKCDELEMVKYL